MTQRDIKHRSLAGLAVLLTAVAFILVQRDRSRDPDSNRGYAPIRGMVIDAERAPIAGARVRFQGEAEVVETDELGAFLLANHAGRATTLTASKSGYVIGSTVSHELATVQLDRLVAEDNREYEWVDPAPNPANDGNCGNCHQGIFDEWNSSAHASSARNPRLHSLLDGTDWSGDAKAGWSLRDEHPLGVGVCAACHAPGINFEAGDSDDMRDVTGVARRGVHCDFCHKIKDVVTDDFGLVHGRFGFNLLRPTQDQLFFGPLDDVDRGEDVYSPLQHESRYCASCHEGTVFGVHVYSTYSEWLDSPARREGKSCQSCHMAPTGKMTNIAPDAGGIERDPHTLASHTLMPGGKEAMLRKCLNIDVAFPEVRSLQGQPLVTACRVTLTARDVGHNVPTGFIDRHLIVVAEAFNAQGVRLRPLSGPLLPEEAGSQLSGSAGQLFGRWLADDGGETPVPFWRPARSTTDTRLAPQQPVSTTFRFPIGTRKVRVRVLYRRFWKQVAEAKQWPDDTITVYDDEHTLRAQITPHTLGKGMDVVPEGDRSVL